MVTTANPGDPSADPTKVWPADRPTVAVGTLIVQKIEAEAGWPTAATSISIRPSLPAGMRDLG